MERTFDRLVHFDERSRDYPIRSLIGAAKKPRSYTWSCKNWLDQGREGACVGFSMAHELSARPAVVTNVSESTAQSIYYLARKLDPWPGEDYEGTSVLAGMKAVQQLMPTKIREYRWAFSLEDVILTLGYKGPVILGINWYTDMMDTDGNGFIHATGVVAGGHAILANGVSVKNKTVRLHNSWGPHWGITGECLISWDDLEKLLYEFGEVCVPIIRSTK